MGNMLITLHARHRNVVNARKVFDIMPTRDMVSWNAMIVGYAQNGYVEEALKCFIHMELQGMKPN
jgi:pentatricopeptide repeat protein